MRAPLAVLLAAVIGGACADVERQTLATGAASFLDSADQVAFQSRTFVPHPGLLRAEVFAETTLFLEQNARIAMRVVSGDFFNAQGSKDATMVGERANYDSRTGNLDAWGNVVVTSVDGRVLKSPMIRFEANRNQITSDSAFVMTEPDGKEMRGVGFETDPNLSVFTVRRLNRGRGGTVNLSNP